MYSNEEDYEDEQESGSSGSVLKDFYNNNKKLIIILAIVLGALIILSLLSKGNNGGGNTTTDVKMTIMFNGEEAVEEKVLVGRSIKLNTQFEGVNNNPSVVWSSSDETIAIVENGTVTGKKLGKVLITAIYENNGTPVPDTCEVVVYEGMENIQLNSVAFPDGDLMMGIGNTYNSKLTYDPYNGYILEKSFTSSNEDVVTIDDDGVIKANRVGSAVISVSVKTLSGSIVADTMNVYVLNNVMTPQSFTNVQSMQFSSQVEKISVNQEYQLTFDTEPNNADAEYLKWTSSDPTVATVENGKVKALKEGVTWIRAYAVGDDNKEVGSILIEVAENIVYVDKITLSEQNLNIKTGDSYNVIATITPDNASNKTFTVSSNNIGVASVEPINGIGFKVKGIGVGTAFITITSTDGKASQQMVVNVTSSSQGGNGNSGEGESGSGGEDSCSSTYIRVRSDKSNVEKSYTASQNSYAKGPVNVTVEMDCGLSKVKYCLGTVSSPCTPNIDKKYTFDITVPDGDMYLIRIIKYDSDGDVIGSNSENYDAETSSLSYYVNTKAKGASVPQGGSVSGDYTISGTCGSSVAVNSTCQLILVRKGTNIPVSDVKWTLSRTGYLTVSSSGLVTGNVATSSAVTISATVDGKVVATKQMMVTGSGGSKEPEPGNNKATITYTSKLEKYNSSVYSLRVLNSSSSFNRLYLCYGSCSGDASSIVNNAKWIDDYLFAVGMYAIDPEYHGANQWYYYNQFGTASTGKQFYIKKPSSGNLKVFIANYNSSSDYSYSSINTHSW